MGQKEVNMRKEEQLDRIRQHSASVIGMDQARKSAVCIPLIDTEDGFDVLFEIRSSKIESQPGDICFPGGMVEPGETEQEAAVREMAEELLVDISQIRVIGPMDIFAGSRLYVYPYVVLLENYKKTFSTDEVEEVFRVPLQFFLENDPEVYYTHMKVIPEENFPFDRIYGGREYAWRDRREEIFFYQYKQYNIWGMTAKMIEALARLIKNSGDDNKM